MSKLLERRKKLQSEYADVCSKTMDEYGAFLESHKTDILSCADPWFFEELIRLNKIEAMKYTLQQYDISKHLKRKCSIRRVFGVDDEQCYPLDIASKSGSFEMIRLLITNGAEPEDVSNDYCSSLIYNILNRGINLNSWPWNNEYRYHFKENEFYLSIQYLLNHIQQKSPIPSRVMSAIIKGTRFDPIQICKLIESKIPFIKETLTAKNIINAIQGKRFNFLECLANEVGINIDERLSANMFGPYCTGFGKYCYVDKSIIQWLLKHNVDINGFMCVCSASSNPFSWGSAQTDRATALFNHCIDRKYKEMELLLDFGADIHKKCIYKGEELSSLEFCVKTFPKEYAEYFQNYKKHNIDDTDKHLGFDLSEIPTTAYLYADVGWKSSMDQISELNELNEEAIESLERSLAAQYNALTSLITKRKEIRNDLLWKKNEETWLQFLKQWKSWNVHCFVEYLKRIKYVTCSYGQYYNADSTCVHKVEEYIKTNVMEDIKQNDDDNAKTYFEGIHISKFTEDAVHAIGITDANDTQSVYDELQKLIKNDYALVGIDIPYEETQKTIHHDSAKQQQLQNTNIELENQYQEMEQKYNDLQQQNMKLKSEYDKLRQEINGDVRFYRKWNHDNIATWIVSLSQEFKVYESCLREKLKEEAVEGEDLAHLSTTDLDRFGIKKFKHKRMIVERIKSLIQSEDKNEGINETAFVG
eukprot:964237_1